MMATLLQRMLTRRLRKRLTLAGWLGLATLLALYGITMCVALLGGVSMRSLVIPALRFLIRPIEIASFAGYPLVCWLGWRRRSLVPSWNPRDGTVAAPFLEE